MKVLAVCALFVVAAQARVMIPPHLSPSSDEMINFINNLNTTWKAGRNFDKESSAQCAKRRGSAIRPQDNERLPLYRPSSHPRPLPETFDAREKWSICRSIPFIRDQGDCGSCWAFGVAGAISDRICIRTRGRVQVNISTQELVTCCTGCVIGGNGCKGGRHWLAWKYYLDVGIVTGGRYIPPEQYDTSYGCMPYTIVSESFRMLDKRYTPAPPCNRTCNEKYTSQCEKNYTTDKHYGSKIYRLPKNEEDIRTDIFYNGPVVARFDLYSDFYAYKSGIYQRHSNKLCDGHIVRLIGWGTENGVKYWLAANSWGVTSGENGYFRIRRGNNECNIEDDVNAGIPREI